MCTKEERRFLLKKLIEYENEMDSQLYGGNQITTLSSNNFHEFSSTPIKKLVIKKRSNSEANSEASFKSRGGGGGACTSVAIVPRKTTGKVMKKMLEQNITLPITLTGFVLHSIGDIVFDRPGYHSETSIYPVGYKITRTDANFKDPEQKCTYTCHIIDNGDSPRFEIIPDNDSEFAISGPSPDYCHTTLLQVIHSATDTRNTNIRPRGEWFFGLLDAIVVNLIQNLPNANRCVNFRGFVGDTVSTDKVDEHSPMNFEALQKHLTIAAYHTVPEIKEEPPDELLDHSDISNFKIMN